MEDFQESDIKPYKIYTYTKPNGKPRIVKYWGKIEKPINQEIKKFNNKELLKRIKEKMKNRSSMVSLKDLAYILNTYEEMKGNQE